MHRASSRAAAEGMPTSHRESDDAYGGVVVQLNDRWRIIECKDRIQWILQFRVSSERAPRIDWKGRSYLTTRQTLQRDVGYLAGPCAPFARAILQQLPARFPKGEKP